jgi:hypothetical protein
LDDVLIVLEGSGITADNLEDVGDCHQQNSLNWISVPLPSSRRRALFDRINGSVGCLTVL